MIWLLVACTPKVPETTASEACDYCGGECLDETQTIGGFQHVDGDVVYPDPPPTSGDHSACWTDWGVHAEDPGDERWVHNEEHGGVVFLYQPADCTAADSGAGNDCASDVDALAVALATEADPRWVVAPYDLLPTAWAAVSWGERRMMGCFDLDAMTGFYADHVGQGREDETGGPPSTCM